MQGEGMSSTGGFLSSQSLSPLRTYFEQPTIITMPNFLQWAPMKFLARVEAVLLSLAFDPSTQHKLASTLHIAFFFAWAIASAIAFWWAYFSTTNRIRRLRQYHADSPSGKILPEGHTNPSPTTATEKDKEKVEDKSPKASHHPGSPSLSLVLVSLVLSMLLGLGHLSIAMWRLHRDWPEPDEWGPDGSWPSTAPPLHGIIFLGASGIAWSSFGAALWSALHTHAIAKDATGAIDKDAPVVFPDILRLWWIVMFALSTLFVASPLLALFDVMWPSWQLMMMDGVLALASWPTSFLLLATGFPKAFQWRAFCATVCLGADDEDLKEPLLGEHFVEEPGGTPMGEDTGLSEEDEEGAWPIHTRKAEDAVVEDGEVGQGEVADGVGVTPFATAGPLSVIFFSWVKPLLLAGSQAPLEMKDLPLLAKPDCSEVNAEILDIFYDIHKDSLPGHSSALFLALWASFWPEIIFNGFLLIIKTLALFVGPGLLGIFVRHISGHHYFTGELAPYEGYILILGLLAGKFLERLLERQCNFNIDRLSMHVHMAIVAQVYKKGIRLSNKARQEHTEAEIESYVRGDADNVKAFMWWLHEIWVFPLQVTLGLWLMYTWISYAAFAGVAVMMVCILLQLPIADMQRRFRKGLKKSHVARIRKTAEALKGMRAVKYQAWEELVQARLEELRSKEYGWLMNRSYIMAANVFLYQLVPTVASTSVFVAALLLNIPLDTASVFTTLATLTIVQDPLQFAPTVLHHISQASGSLKRLSAFLHAEEVPKDAVRRGPAPDDTLAVQILNATFSWSKNKPVDTPPADAAPGGAGGSRESDVAHGATLHNIHLEIEKRARVMICGPPQSGKSSLLASLLGEIPRVAGKVVVSGKVAYVSQTPWLFTGTIRDNILFGSKMEGLRYRETLRVCNLLDEIEALMHGDETQLGEQGVAISKGMKQRLQLARAIYSDADVYLLDEPFNGLDTHTRIEVFRETVMNALDSKTVLLVTHQVEFLPAADLILMMRDGEIVQAGCYQELVDAGTDFSALSPQPPPEVGEKSSVAKAPSSLSYRKPGMDVPASSTVLERKGSKKQLSPSQRFARCESEGVTPDEDAAEEAGNLDSDSAWKPSDALERETTTVDASVYVSYLTSFYGGLLIPFIILSQALFVFFQITSSAWLAYATDVSVHIHHTNIVMVYGALAMGSVFFVLLRAILAKVAGLATAQTYFRTMLKVLLKAPLSFFESTPASHILKRASADQSTVDVEVPTNFTGLLNQAMCVVGILIVTGIVTWPVFILIIPMAVAYYFLQHFYLSTMRELSVILGTTAAPVVLHFSESVEGARTIRAFDRQRVFARNNLALLNRAARPDFQDFAASKWLTMRIELMSNFYFACAAILLVAAPPGTFTPGLAALSLLYGLTLSTMQTYVVWTFSSLDAKMSTVKRLSLVSNLPQEGSLHPVRAPPRWPTTGTVELQHLNACLRPGAPLALNNVSCVINPAEHVAFVGRSGCGKAAIPAAIFRIIESTSGRIFIDGVNIATLGLRDIRSRLSHLPQDPVLFEGSVRSNLDPFENHTDNAIWEALDKVQLGDIVRALGSKLESQIQEDAQGWNLGLRQLFYLAKAILKRSPIIIIDEPKIPLDAVIDVIIKNILKEEFEDRTVIRIARHIPNAVKMSRVHVLENGVLVESDTPKALLENKESLFSKLLVEATIVSTKRAHGAIVMGHI